MLLFKKKNLNILDFFDAALEEYKRIENSKWENMNCDEYSMYDYLASMFSSTNYHVSKKKNKKGNKGSSKRYGEEYTEIHFYLDITDKSNDQIFNSLDAFDLSITNLNIDVSEETSLFILNNNVVHCTIIPMEEKDVDDSIMIKYHLVASNSWQSLFKKCEKILEYED